MVTLLLTALLLATGPLAPARADCRPLAQPKKLPALDAVLDSAALVTRLRAADSTAAEVLLGVFLATPSQGRVLEPVAPPAAAELALREVLAALRPAASTAIPGFRVRVRFGPTPGLSLERSILCAPESDGADARGQVLARPASDPTVRGRSITPSFRINALGEVTEVQLGSGTGVPELDRAIREDALARRYRPATLDGRPIDVMLTGTRVEIIR